MAAFVSKLGDEVARLFAQVLVLCDAQGLIGREMFAIDGVKLPSNASKARIGTCANICVWPGGKRLCGDGSNCTIKGCEGVKFQGAKQDCVPCEWQHRCLRTPDKTQADR